MIKRDYYEVLELDRNADADEIKKSYRRLAMQFHPDRNNHDPKAEEKFKEASEAYEVLSDSRKRQLYDAYGHQGLEGSGFHGFGDMNDVFSSMGDIFEEFFGGMGGFGRAGSSRNRAYRGSDLRHDISISFMESAKGAEKEFSISKHAVCDTCSGSGLKPGTEKKVCKICNGSGAVTQRQGFFMIQTACPNCGGQGARIETPCDDCRGHGKVRKSKKLKVKVPAGIESGMRLILRSEGQAGENGGPPGDLYVFISVEEDDFFKRSGDDVVCEIPISFPEAALGCKQNVPTLEGEEEIKIPEGSETGDKIKLPGKGFPSVDGRGRIGNQYVFLRVKTPKKLSRKQKKILEEFMESK